MIIMFCFVIFALTTDSIYRQSPYTMKWTNTYKYTLSKTSCKNTIIVLTSVYIKQETNIP